jgi:GTP-binding protein
MQIALIGRSSVGKSTLFNRLADIRDRAITHESPGVTRDYKVARAKLWDLEFEIIDTAGIEDTALSLRVKYQLTKLDQIQSLAAKKSLEMINRANVIFFMVDGKVDITPLDEELAKFVRACSKPVVFLVNKCEKAIVLNKEYYKMGFGDPIMISAEHGVGLSRIYEALKEHMPSSAEEEIELDYKPSRKEIERQQNALKKQPKIKHESLKLAIIGRPNTGKSTYINALIAEDRLLTSAFAGTTRDTVDIEWQFKEQDITLIDTAGLRKKSKIDDEIELLSCGQTINAIRRSNTVILMIDAVLGMQDQDLKIANLAIEEGKCLVVAFNKWDLIIEKVKYKKEVDYLLETHLAQIKGVPAVYLSAEKKSNLFTPIDEAIQLYVKWNTKITTSKLNQWLEYATSTHSMPMQKSGKSMRIKYCTQVAIRPPTFKLFSNQADKIPMSYKKYLLNSIRESFELDGIPMRFDFIKPANPFKK